MIGVVLWSDPGRRKAVIWCEDQKDLAYFDGTSEGHLDGTPETNAGQVAFEEGDMLLFDVCDSGVRRVAVNPRRVARAAATELVQGLKSKDWAPQNESPKQEPAQSNVLRFPKQVAWRRTPSLVSG